MNPDLGQYPLTSQLKKQNWVLYRTNAWKLKGRPALLQWTANRVQLLEVDPLTHQPGKAIFDVIVTEITGLEAANQLLTLTIADKEYHLNFSPKAGALAAIMQLLGVKVAAYRMSPMQDVIWWRQHLLDQGVKTKLSKASRLVIIGFVIFAIIVLVTQIV